MKCDNCSYENLAGSRTCQNCGHALRQPCSNCGTLNSPAANFCQYCGTGLGESAPLAAKSRLNALQKAAPPGLQEKIRAVRPELEGNRKPVSILFSDIVGSTSLAEKLDPEEWKEVVNGAHRRVSEAVYRYEGTIAQLLGDGVLAFFGAPIVHEDDPVRAVRAALDIQDSMDAYERELAGYLDSFQLRIGINTGIVVVGSVGDDLHMEYLAIGDSVNLAARLQSAARPGRILISEYTARLLGQNFELDDLEEIEVKGKDTPVKVFEVAGLAESPGSGRGVAGLESPLVGREAELTRLQESIEALQDGLGGIAFVLGEAGIGKSRLVEEVRRSAGEELRWLEGRALSYGQSLSYWSLVQVIQEDLSLSDSDPEARIRVALRRRMEVLFSERSGDVTPYLGHLLGLSQEGPAGTLIASLEGETLKHQTILSLEAYFRALGEEEPTVLVFEDIHWADASTINVLDRLLELTDRVPLVFLFLARQQREHASWGLKLRAETDFSHRYTEIQLKPLSQENANVLVDNLLTISELPSETRNLMLTRADGNPFYLEELIRSLIDSGGLVREGDRWVAGREISALEIPENLQGVLLARIDRLEEDVRRTLQLAAVIGKSFLYRLLEAIAGAERELDSHLSQLQRVDLVREKTRRPELEYIFKHSLTQEAAYNSLLLERRREFHQRVGEVLEELFGDRQDDYLGLLAHHFDRAEDLEKATVYLLKAGDKARLEDSQQEAAQYYRRAIELLVEQDDDALAAQTWLKLGLVYHIDFRFEEAHQANEAAFRLLQAARKETAGSDTAAEARTGEGRIFKSASFEISPRTLDPGLVVQKDEGVIVTDLFAGIAELDPELNVLPHGAISWEVFDGGRRYIIHLRDDVFWTDGTPVTAQDYTWAWIRNLNLNEGKFPGSLLDDIRGARAYRLGENQDPASVGVQALDQWTLEVELENPVAYFPYLLALPVTFPQPRTAIERFEEGWWRPGKLICNGPYRLVEFDGNLLISYERNPEYFGDTPGNLDRVEWHIIHEDDQRARLFRLGELDFTDFSRSELPPDLAAFEMDYPSLLHLSYILLAPVHPLDDLRVRRALFHALDKKALAAVMQILPAHGGIIPPGMAGHSPDIGLAYDLPLARRLLSEAGYPEGRNFPAISGRSHLLAGLGESISASWRDNLGIDITFKLGSGADWGPTQDIIYCHGWQADFPDPDNFLRQPAILEFLTSHGWRNPDFEDLLKQAAETPNRNRRMALYRRADRYLVVEQAFVLPLNYGAQIYADLKQPWVRDLGVSPQGFMGARYISIDFDRRKER
jgi:ABC-type oligopeptide transport system substrate-binding subunit/class 3 adenylate cyclase